MNKNFIYNGIEYTIENDCKHIRRLIDNKKPESQRFVAMSFLRQNHIAVDNITETTHSAVRKIYKFLNNDMIVKDILTERKIMNHNENKDKDVILINNLFTGAYISKMENIGHEFINIYKSDNGSFYVYANPYGNIQQKWDGRVKYVLFVRAVLRQKKLQVVGYAEVEEQILDKAVHSKKNTSASTRKVMEKHYNNQLDYIKKNEVKYGGVLLNDIFCDNSDEIDLPYFITFKASNIYKASKEIILPENTNGETISRTSEAMKIYVTKDSENSSFYQNFLDLIQDKSNWDKIEESIVLNENIKPSILSIVRKNYDENVISNFLAYIIENDKDFWLDFSKKVLGRTIKEKPHFIGRETEKRIDLFIHVENKIIVIENKVKSAINGIDKEDKKLSQLSKYYEHTLKRAKKLNVSDNNCFFYVLRPNYNKEDIQKYNKGEHYKVINYSEINDLLINKSYSIDCIDEFKSIISIHSSDFDNEIFDKQKELLMNQIRKLSEK